MLPIAARAALVALPVALSVVACGSSSDQRTPTSSPLPTPALQHLYAQAADAYNRAEVPIEQAEYAHCTAGAAGANLADCEAALSQDRQYTLSFDNAIRSLNFPAAAKADVDKLLSDDAKLEGLLEQAATAPSLTVIQSLANQIFSLLTTTTADAETVRKDIGLPPASAPPVTPTP